MAAFFCALEMDHMRAVIKTRLVQCAGPVATRVWVQDDLIPDPEAHSRGDRGNGHRGIMIMGMAARMHLMRTR